MYMRVRRLLSVLLASALVMAVFALPAYAETTSGPGPATIAVKAKSAVVGILNTMKASGSTEKGHAAGTGFVYKSGIIITNAHVVENAQELKILYPDKTTEVVTPNQIFADATSDVAVIKVKNTSITPVTLGNSDTVTVGETVVAVGNPLGFRLGNSVSSGILSGVGRAVGSAYPFLQVDAAINPGNSGGPLFNLKGEVIGINSAKMAEIGVEGLAFAIPINTAKQIAETLIKDGKVERATLGVELYEDWQAYFGVPNEEGVTISSIISDGPVGLTGLRSGDRLVRLDDTPVYTSDDVHAFLAGRHPGDQVTITVRRSGQILVARVTLASQDALRKLAEEQGANEEVGGILIGLTAGQIQEAADFGKRMAMGYADVNDDYFAVSGSNYAVLWTEYLYVARRISSAYEFGFTPGVGFQQSVAKEIHGKLEVQMEIHGDSPDFLQGATYSVQQGGTKVLGATHGSAVYTTSPDGKVIIANVAVRFLSGGLKSTEDLTVTVTQQSGKTATFQFSIKDLR
ncbi:MAG TPA: trypsin-like peptidase domain-containing protein [Symbiobacteriaceae bacterium]|nr:trypsin-like peptidase domain-containing protein [Symbiobacteriaceae bacterium]